MRLASIGLVLGLTALAGCGDWERGPASSETLVSTTASVIEVDRESRRVVLEDEGGDRVSVIVPPDLPNFGQIDAGDVIEIDYYRSVMAQVAPHGVSNAPIIATEGGRSAPGETPAGFGVVATDIVVTLLDYNEDSYRAKIRLADGDERAVTVPRELRSFVSSRSPGERIEVTIVEAAAIALQEV